MEEKEKLSTAIKSRRFCECEKSWLYKQLQSKKREEHDEKETKFKKLISGIVQKYYDPDLLLLGQKSYCMSTNEVHISAEPLGLENHYSEKDSKGCKVGSVDVSRRIYLDFKLPTKLNGKGYREEINITGFLKERCSEPELDLIKESLYDLAKSRYAYSYFGYNTWIGYGYSGRFSGIDTWGQLYNKSPEYYRLISDRYMSESEKEKINSETQLIERMKAVLGY